jgi:hypothetical protein
MNALAPVSGFDRLEAAISGLPPVELETVHHFAPHVYAREIRIPAGVMLTGKIHKTEHLNVVCGDITVFNEIEGTERRIIGHETFVSKPGTRRAGFAHRPTIWTVIHPTDETDLAKIEDEVIETHYNPLLIGAERRNLK